MQNVYALLAGLGVGVFFSLLRLPIPAPPTISGILGIVGVYLGYILINYFKG